MMKSTDKDQVVTQPASPPLLPQHIFYEDPLVIVGLTRFPIIPGHVTVQCRADKDLMALDDAKFLRIMLTIREVTPTVLSLWHIHRCGLTYDGGRTVSIIPLHGISKEWEPTVYGEQEYYPDFPGYLTSKTGPKMADSFLEETSNRIAKVSGITRPFNTRFDGDAADQNLFARIVRGEQTQWRIWEDDFHVAFLTPFGNTPGFTVIVPRKHLGSDILALSNNEYVGIVQAAYTVAQHLKEAFGVKRCGMFFEGYEIDYAHVKLVPVHCRSTTEGPDFDTVTGAANFHEMYQGYLTTQPGPLASDLDSISAQAEAMRNLQT